MQLDPALLARLVCPSSKRPLREATPAELAAVNARVASGSARTRGGEVVQSPLPSALVVEGGEWIYPVREGIPILLTPEAIAL